MQHTNYAKYLCLIPAFGALVMIAGCPSSRPQLPEEVEIELPDGTTVDAGIGDGAASLADSEWIFYRKRADGSRGAHVLRIPFGSEGEVVSFEDSTLGSEVFGDQIILDGRTHETGQDGLTYQAATFGGENDSGVAFESRVLGFFAGIRLATATASATGVYTNDEWTTMEGEFTFDVEIELALLRGTALADIDDLSDTFEFIAERVEE